MPFNSTRLKNLPYVLKLNTIGATILVILSVGSASYQPPGTYFVWMTSVFALITDLFFNKHNSSFLSWPLVECIFSILFGITYFISAWLCIMVGSTYNEGSLAFTLAGVFCLGNFIQYTFNLFLFVRIWIADQRKAMNVIDTSSFGVSSYGSP
uniref:MARVEL domain-containing protein n=1 Tax=Ditylenchus dipsaci TaxID=166011 RepID=A0A915DFI5_9BILA